MIDSKEGGAGQAPRGGSEVLKGHAQGLRILLQQTPSPFLSQPTCSACLYRLGDPLRYSGNTPAWKIATATATQLAICVTAKALAATGVRLGRGGTGAEAVQAAAASVLPGLLLAWGPNTPATLAARP